MNMGYPIRRHDERRASRWSEQIRFVGSAIGIWAVCATGIYLIGPAEADEEALASAPAPTLAAHRIPIATIASYEQ